MERASNDKFVGLLAVETGFPLMPRSQSGDTGPDRAARARSRAFRGAKSTSPGKASREGARLTNRAFLVDCV